MVSHDLRNPLNNVRICAQMLGKVPGDPEKVSEVAERIDRATDRMAQLISDLLDAAKIEGGRLQTERRPEPVGELVESAVEGSRAIAAEKSIQIRVASFPASLTALCDRHLVLRVFSNLLGNAIKFSPTGAAIDVRAKELGGEILFSVKDNGPGISPEHLPHAFDRYWQQTSDSRGTGLGLYIAKGIVEAHGGRIWIDSVVGQGTEVQFTLPSAHALETSMSRSL
jgi:signal transduction histidine kinase